MAAIHLCPQTMVWLVGRREHCVSPGLALAATAMVAVGPHWTSSAVVQKRECLLKPVYGQLDAPRRWFLEACQRRKKLQWAQNQLDPCAFTLSHPH